MGQGIVWTLQDRHDSRMGGFAVSRLYVGTVDGVRVASIRGAKSGVSSLHWTASVETGGPDAVFDEASSEGFGRLADAKAWVAGRLAGDQP